jgi:hypothetical protein
MGVWGRASIKDRTDRGEEEEGGRSDLDMRKER